MTRAVGIRKIGTRAMSALVLALGLVWVSFLLATGVDAVSSIRLLAVVAIQSYAGAWTWQRLSRVASVAEVLGVGIALGMLLSLLTGLAVSALGFGSWGWAVPAVVVLVLQVAGLRRRDRRSVAVGVPASDGAERALDRPTSWALVLGAVLALGFLIINVRHYPLIWTGSWSGYHPDMPYFEALATSIAKLGPDDSIFLSGFQIRYHWLAYGWAGQVTQAAGAQPFVVLTRVLPLVATSSAVLLVTSWARALSRVAWVPAVATAALLMGGHLGAVIGGVLNFDSPSQSVGVSWLLAYSVILWRGLALPAGSEPQVRRVWWVVVVLLGLLAAGLTGAKVSAAAPALAGVLLLAVVGIVRREAWGVRAVHVACASLVGAGLAYWLVLSGATGGGGLALGQIVDRAASQQGFNPIEGPLGVALGTGILVIAVAARWAGLFWLAGSRGTRWDPATVFGMGLAVLSLAALMAFNSFNEVWFALAVSGPLAALSAAGAGEAAAWLQSRRDASVWRITWFAAGGAAAVYAVVWLVWATGPSGGAVWVSTWRWVGPMVGLALSVLLGLLVARWGARTAGLKAGLAAMTMIVVFATVPGRLLGVGTGQAGVVPGLRPDLFSFGVAPSVRGRDEKLILEWSSDAMAAAQWLREHAGATDLLATNLTFGPFVPAVTGLPTYVSAIQYQAPYGRPAAAGELLRREGEVWDFLADPTSATAAPLCRAGVRWIWVDPTTPGRSDWRPLAEALFHNAQVTILRMSEDDCG